MKSYTCQFCGAQFATKKTFGKHQLTARFCIALRQTTDELNAAHRSQIDELRAEHELQIARMRADHRVEIDRRDQMLLNLTQYQGQQRANRLEQLYGDLPPADLSDERIRNIIETELSLNDICNGQKSVAVFVSDHILTTEDGVRKIYVCTDPSRYMFVFRDKDGVLVRDSRAHRLLNVLEEPLREHSSRIYLDSTDHQQDAFQEEYVEIHSIRRRPSKFIKELASRACL